MTVLDLPLHRIPVGAVPHDPRLGATCVPVPPARIAALTRSGSAVLGLHAGHPTVESFVESLLAELRALLDLPGDHECMLVPAGPDLVARILRAEPWAAGRAVRVARAESARPDADGWLLTDLTRTTAPLSGAAAAADVAFFCPSWLLGVGPGCTVVTLSARAAAAARVAAAARAARPVPGACLADFLPGGAPPPFAVPGVDLLMLANGIREAAESEPGSTERAAAERHSIVRSWAVTRSWVTAMPERTGGDLVTMVPTDLPAPAVTEIAALLEARHLAYGLAAAEAPGAFHIGLCRWIDLDDLDRLLALLDVLVAAAGRGRR